EVAVAIAVQPNTGSGWEVGFEARGYGDVAANVVGVTMRVGLVMAGYDDIPKYATGNRIAIHARKSGSLQDNTEPASGIRDRIAGDDDRIAFHDSNAMVAD